MKRFAGNYQEQLLEFWTKFAPYWACICMDEMNPVFKIHNNCSHSFGLDTLMTYFLYGHMVQNNLKYFSEISSKIEIY